MIFSFFKFFISLCTSQAEPDLQLDTGRAGLPASRDPVGRAGQSSERAGRLAVSSPGGAALPEKPHHAATTQRKHAQGAVRLLQR